MSQFSLSLCRSSLFISPSLARQNAWVQTPLKQEFIPSTYFVLFSLVFDHHSSFVLILEQSVESTSVSLVSPSLAEQNAWVKTLQEKGLYQVPILPCFTELLFMCPDICLNFYSSYYLCQVTSGLILLVQQPSYSATQGCQQPSYSATQGWHVPFMNTLRANMWWY